MKQFKELNFNTKESCSVAGLSRSSYYSVISHTPKVAVLNKAEDGAVLEKIRLIQSNHPFWGYRRIWAWHKHGEGVVINKKKVYRLMRDNGLLLKVKKIKPEREFKKKPKADSPLQYWGIDMTKFLIPSLGWVYLVSEFSDNGSQPTSTLGIEQIFTMYDNPKGNAETERVMRTIKEEIIWLNEFAGQGEGGEMD